MLGDEMWAIETYRIVCQRCRSPYLGRAFTMEERKEPKKHQLAGRPIVCRRCKVEIPIGPGSYYVHETI